MSHEQNVGQNHNTNIAINVAKFKYLGTTLTNENYMHKEIKSRLNSGIPCYCSFPEDFGFRFAI